jgi:hypothetical protein
MKKTLQLAAIAMSVVACAPMKTEDNVISVVDTRETGMPKIDASEMNNRDAAVYYTGQTIFGDAEGSYRLVYYHNYSGEMQPYSGLIESEMIYDQAKYEWQNDTSIRFTLMSSATEEEYEVNLFGNGKRSGMHFDEDEDVEFLESNMKPIVDARETGLTEMDLDKMQNKDVIVSRTSSSLTGESKGSYVLNFYNENHGKLRRYTVSLGMDTDYDQFKSQWENDTTVNITLVNSSTGTSEIHKVFGSDNATGLLWDTEEE